MSLVVNSPEQGPLPSLSSAMTMRAVVEGLRSPRPFASELPGMLQEDELCVRMTQAFDEVLAPVFATLDCVDAYFDAELAPDDFVDWLAGWVGVEIDEHWESARRRALLGRIADLYRIRGTVEGLSAHIEMYAGVVPEILENGGTKWSQTEETALPGSEGANLTVRLRVPDPAAVNRLTVERIVEASRPAHLVYTVEILTAAGQMVESTDDDRSPAAAADESTAAVDLPGSEHINVAPGRPGMIEPESSGTPTDDGEPAPIADGEEPAG